jgi:hypothetical protein
MPSLTDKYRYQIFPDRIYFIRDDIGNVIEVSGQQIVESLSNGQKNKETERKTSELNQTQS